MMNHRESWALEETAPNAQAWARESEAFPASTPTAAALPSAKVAPVAAPPAARALVNDEILIVASKLKDYIRERSDDFSTSANVMPKLSTWVRRQCDRAIRNAEQAGRKTVLDRDIL